MALPHTNAKLDFEGDGWLGYTPPNARYAVHIHVSHKSGPGRWVVDAVELTGFRVTPRMLRDLPLGRVEAQVNHLAQQGLVDPAEGKLAFAVQFGDPEKGETSWVPKPPPAAAKGAKGDEFYRQVGEIYAMAAAASTRPAADLAEAWELPITTIHRWIRESRRRGHLPPAEQGRRG